MAEKDKKEVTSRSIGAMSEANQTLVENLTAAQERNLKYAQSVFENTIDLLKSHMEATRSVLEQWEQQAPKQQGAPGVAQSVAGLMRTPLNAYQQVLDLMETASRQNLENLQKALESFQKSVQQATQQATRAAEKAEK